MHPDLPTRYPAAFLADGLDACPHFRRLALARTLPRLADGRVDLSNERTGHELSALLGNEVHRLLGAGSWTCHMHVNDHERAAFVEISHAQAGQRVLSLGTTMAEAAAAGLLVIWATKDTKAARVAVRVAAAAPAEA